jgi:hypothetical protein
VIWVTERRLGLRLSELAPTHYVSNLARSSVLLLTGSEDPHAPPEGIQKLVENCVPGSSRTPFPAPDTEMSSSKAALDTSNSCLISFGVI